MIEGRQVQIAPFDLQNNIEIINAKLTSICFTNLFYRSKICHLIDRLCKNIIEVYRFKIISQNVNVTIMT